MIPNNYNNYSYYQPATVPASYSQQMLNTMQQTRPGYLDNSSPVIKGRPVASIEEARACMIDLDGSVFYFPDTAQQKIYTKQINLDGTSSLKVYELVPAPTPMPMDIPKDALVTKEEFNKALEEIAERFKMLTRAEAPKPSVQVPVESLKELQPESADKNYSF